MLAERGIAVSYETVRRWVNHFGPVIAAHLRNRRPKPHATWHLDEVYLKIDGRMAYLWRAVDGEGEVLDVLVQSKRNKHAALKLVRVDEFDQTKACGEADDGSEVSFGLFASERDALEALEPSDALLDARAGFVEGAGKEGWLILFVGLVGDDRSDAARSRGVPIGLTGVAFVADDGAGLNVGPDIEQGFEVTPVEGFAAGQVKGDDIPGGVRFCVDFRGETTTRAPQRLAVLPPFAPAADT